MEACLPSFHAFAGVTYRFPSGIGIGTFEKGLKVAVRVFGPVP
jgi:hypothetical protein